MVSPPAGRAKAGIAGESRSAARVMDILELFLTGHERLTLTDISNRLDIPKSSAHAILQTMRRRGYLAWDPQTKAYSIGLRLVALAQAAPILRTIQGRARRYLERLSERLHETALLCAYEADGIVVVDKVESPTPVRYTVQVGERWPLHCTTVGKLYLASLTGDEARALLGRTGLERFTDQTPTSVEQVLAELVQVRRDGFAVNRAEIIDGVTGYGAPVYAAGGTLIGGLAVVGPSERVAPKADAIAEEIVAAARSLSDELGAGLDSA